MAEAQRKAVAWAGKDEPTPAIFRSSAFQVVVGRSPGRPTQSPHQMIGRFFLLVVLGAIALLATALDAHENGHE